MPLAARQNDTVAGTDIHIVLVPSPGGPVPTPGPHPFNGPLMEQLSTDVLIGGRAAATVGSVARCAPPHLPVPPGGPFQRPPTNQGRVQFGSTTVLINGKGSARQGDPVMTCNDPVDAPTSSITTGDPTVVIA